MSELITEQLPLTIKASSDLTEKFQKLNSNLNKLEAQLNFHTLTANWYGDEEDILNVMLCVMSSESFIVQRELLETVNDNHMKIEFFSDDVLHCAQKQQSECYIALTASELSLISEKPKVLADFLRIKLSKVLNLIAHYYQLPTI